MYFYTMMLKTQGERKLKKVKNTNKRLVSTEASIYKKIDLDLLIAISKSVALQKRITVSLLFLGNLNGQN